MALKKNRYFTPVPSPYGGDQLNFTDAENRAREAFDDGGSTTKKTTTKRKDIEFVELPDGKIAVGLSQKDFRTLLSQQPGAKVTGRELVGGQERPSQSEQMAKQGLINLAKTTGQIDPEIARAIQAGEIDIGQVIGGGLAGAIPGVVGGAAVGAVAGGIGAVPGAVTGGTATFLAGIRSNIASQRRGQVQASKQGLSDGITNLRKLITAANSDPANVYEYLQMFNEQLSYIERDYGNLKLDTQGFLKDITGVDGTPELADFERFYDYERTILITSMQTAIINPNPNLDLSLSQAGIEPQI